MERNITILTNFKYFILIGRKKKKMGCHLYFKHRCNNDLNPN